MSDQVCHEWMNKFFKKKVGEKKNSNPSGIIFNSSDSLISKNRVQF